jgi:hypothetical protein
MTMRQKWQTRFAWAVTGLILIISFYRIGRLLASDGAAMGWEQLANRIAWLLCPVVFAIPAALIIAHQPRNVIGWLLFTPAAGMSTPDPLTTMMNVAAPPANPSFAFYALVWFDNLSWILLILPILLIPLLFPDGRPPTPRWRWVTRYAIGTMLFLIVLGTIVDRLTPLNIDATWSIDNPIGFLSDQLFESAYFNVPWTINLIILAITCFSALVVRFRRAQGIERAQIKWLLTACAFFTVVYSMAGTAESEGTEFYLQDVLFVISLMTLPLAIAMAILRHRLFDIDVIIRKGLAYGVLTGTLGLTFWGSVVILQYLFNQVLGAQSQAALVISTLGIAALFTPVRNRVQTFIDRRFFRQKYDGVRLLEEFSHAVRNETDLKTLTTDLVAVVHETMQPQSISIWMHHRAKR